MDRINVELRRSIHLALLCVAILTLDVRASLLNALKIHGRSQMPEISGNVSVDQGYLMCAGNHMVGEAVQMIWQLRHRWGTRLGISVAHCGEITPENQEFIRLVDPSVKLLDVCMTDPVLGMPIATARWRLRGFYCKVAAMVLSPFKETMLLDLDVVWFKSPDVLFNSKIYTDHGVLYFRDRAYASGADRQSDYKLLQQMFVSKGYSMDLKTVSERANANGVSFFWKFIQSTLPGGTPFPQINDIQDSSVVLIDRSRNAALLKVMTELIPSFDFGYGDKELFWVAATLAGANFTFSPFLAGQYADCYGIILHFDPNDDAHPEQASPLYVNGEYMVEHDLTIVGEFLSPHMTPPVLVTEDLIPALTLNTWPGYGARGLEGCTCKTFGCVDVPTDVTKFMLYAEWTTYSKRLSRKGPEEDCVPVLAAYTELLQEVFSTAVQPRDCFFVGCPHLPIAIDTTLPWNADATRRRFCDPVHFGPIPPTNLPALAAAARRPDSSYNHPNIPDGTPIQCDFDRTLYWYKNGTLYPFGNWNAFVSKGLDLDNVVRLPRRQFESFPRSDQQIL